jgi:hypothetical protein
MVRGRAGIGGERSVGGGEGGDLFVGSGVDHEEVGGDFRGVVGVGSVEGMRGEGRNGGGSGGVEEDSGWGEGGG